MRALFVVFALVLVPSTAQAHSLRLLDVGLHLDTGAPADSADDARLAEQRRIAGVTLLEGVASVGTNVTLLVPAVVAGVLVTNSITGKRCEFCGFGIAVTVLGLGSLLSIAAPFVTSLVVLMIDRTVHGSAGYGKILAYSWIARALTLVAGFAFGGFIGAGVSMLFMPVTGMIGELIAVRTSPLVSPANGTVLAFSF